MSATIAFFGILVPLVKLEISIIAAVPLLGVLGRAVFVLFAMIASTGAAFVWALAGGKRLKAIEAWERKRDEW